MHCFRLRLQGNCFAHVQPFLFGMWLDTYVQLGVIMDIKRNLALEDMHSYRLPRYITARFAHIQPFLHNMQLDAYARLGDNMDD